MKCNHIVFLLPNSGSKPVGGVKVVLEYANRLVDDGYEVDVVYSAFSPFNIWDIKHRLVYLLQFFMWSVSKSWLPRWMRVDGRVRQRFVWSHGHLRYPHDAKFVATSVDTAVELDKYEVPDNNKFYFIQDFENWFASSDFVYETYHYPMKKIVVSQWLKEAVESCGEKACVVCNGFDFHKFHMTIPPSERDKYQIAFMYHTDKRKGIDTAFKAFALVSQRHPMVHLAVFGAMLPNREFPLKATFSHSPNPEKFLELYNTSSIYVGASETEGWGLTIGEAMQCGCAVACTDNSGYLEMAHDGDTALVSPVGDAKALADNICRLIEDDTLRNNIAFRGNEYIQQFDIEKSYDKFKHILQRQAD